MSENMKPSEVMEAFLEIIEADNNESLIPEHIQEFTESKHLYACVDMESLHPLTQNLLTDSLVTEDIKECIKQLKLMEMLDV